MHKHCIIHPLALFSHAFILLICVSSFSIQADERAKKGKCYLTGGFGENQQAAIKLAQTFNLNHQSFELFERKDKKIYVTVGKIDTKLFEKLKLDNKIPEGYYCSSGKGFQKRYNFTSDYRIFPGEKRFIDSETEFNKVFNMTTMNYSLTSEKDDSLSNQGNLIDTGSRKNKQLTATPKKNSSSPVISNSRKFELDLANFKLMHPAWYSGPANYIEDHFSASSCSVIQNGNFDAAKNDAMIAAKKDINDFLGSSDEVNATNKEGYLGSIQSGVYLNRSEQVYVNEQPFYCVLASISYNNVQKSQESQLQLVQTVDQIKSEIMTMLNKKINFAARGVFSESIDFRDIYRNFNSYVEYGDYDLAHQMFEAFVMQDMEEGINAHLNFIEKMQNYKSQDEIQEIYLSLTEQYPSNRTYQLMYALTKRKIDSAIYLKDLIMDGTEFIPVYMEFLFNDLLDDDEFWVPSMFEARYLALEKLVDVGLSNVQKYYPFDRKLVEELYSGIPAEIRDIEEYRRDMSKESFIAEMSIGRNVPWSFNGAVQLYFSEWVEKYAFEIEVSINDGPFTKLKRDYNQTEIINQRAGLHDIRIANMRYFDEKEKANSGRRIYPKSNYEDQKKWRKQSFVSSQEWLDNNPCRIITNRITNQSICVYDGPEEYDAFDRYQNYDFLLFLQKYFPKYQMKMGDDEKMIYEGWPFLPKRSENHFITFRITDILNEISVRKAEFVFAKDYPCNYSVGWDVCPIPIK